MLFYRLRTPFFLGFILLLSGCLGGGGGSGETTSTGDNTQTLPKVAKVLLTIENNHQPADGKTPVTLTAQVRDLNNLPLAEVNVTFRTDSQTAQFSTFKGTTDAQGLLTVTITNKVAETFDVLADAAGAQNISAEPVQVTFVDATIDPRVSTVDSIVTNDPQPADGKAKITLTVIVRDQSGVPVSGVAVSLISHSDFAIFEPLSGTTGEDGRFTTTVTSSKAETFQVIPIAGGMKGKTVAITFVDGSIDPRIKSVKLVVTNNSQRANGIDQVTLTVIARDTTDTPIASAQVNLISGSDSASLGAVSGMTGEDGRFTTHVTNKVAETFQVTPIAGGVKGEAVEVIFVAGGQADKVELESSDAILSTGATATLTTTVFSSIVIGIDADGREIKKYSNLPNVSIKVSTTGSAELGNVPATTDGNGQATFTVTSKQQGNVTVTVTSGIVKESVTLYFGASLSLLPPTANAIGKMTLKALLKDGDNAPLTGETIYFSFIQSENETLAPPTAITTNDGTAETIVTDLGQDGGITIVKVKAGQLTAQSVIHFLTDLGQGRQLEATTSATVLTTQQTATITATIKDTANIPVSGQPITFSVAQTEGGPSIATISEPRPANSLTDENGEVRVTISNTQGENVIITVKAGTVTQKIPLYFGSTIQLLTTDTVATADGTTPIKLTASVRDASGAGIPGITVDFRAIKGNNVLLDPFRSVTNELGLATVNVFGATVEEVTIRAQANGLTAETTVKFEASTAPFSMMLETNPSEPIELSLNGTATITAVVHDKQGRAVKEGTRINFKTSNEIGSITESVFTREGKATAIFNAGTKAGLTIVTASVVCEAHCETSVTAEIPITVKPSTAGVIELIEVNPKEIGIMGSGVAQSATIRFTVKDNLGNQVKDGTEVNFSLGKTTLGGGETITTGQTEGGSDTVGITSNGVVTVTLKSGTVAGNVDVIATVAATQVSTLARVTIVGSLPDADHFSLAVEYRNLAGGVTFGLQNVITAFVGDRFGNIVPDGTSVSFITEGGTIGRSVGNEAFTTTTELGQATAILQTAAPTTPNLGGIPTLRQEGYECNLPFRSIISNVATQLCSNPGLVTMVAYTTGSESFADTNGNGRYDEGEPFKDLSEPFIDGNNNGEFDFNELYIDVNQNKLFDKPDGKFQDNTTIWSSTVVLFSAATALPQVTPVTFTIPNGGSQTFTVDNIGDIYGNALVAGSRFTVTTNDGILGGTTDFTFPDSNDLGNSAIQFTLASNPAKEVTDTDKDGNKITRLEYPPKSAATITLKIISPLQNNAPGGNGDVEKVISGSVNAF